MYAYTMVDIERGGQGPDGGVGINIPNITVYQSMRQYSAI